MWAAGRTSQDCKAHKQDHTEDKISLPHLGDAIGCMQQSEQGSGADADGEATLPPGDPGHGSCRESHQDEIESSPASGGSAEDAGCKPVSEIAARKVDIDQLTVWHHSAMQHEVGIPDGDCIADERPRPCANCHHDDTAHQNRR